MELEKEFIFKQKNKRTPFIDTFLEKRKRDRDLALIEANNPRYKYNCINNQEEILLNKNKYNFYYEKEINNSYNNLRNNSKEGNQTFKINENNLKYNIKTSNNKLTEQNNNLLFKKEERRDMEKKYNDLKNNSIFLSNEQKKDLEINNRYKINDNLFNINVKNKNNGFGNNVKNEKINYENYYIFEKNRLTSPQTNRNKNYFGLNNKDENNSLNNTVKNKVIYNNENFNFNNNICQIDKSKNIDGELDYYEGEENHRFYDSSGVNDYLYSYESYKVKKYFKKNDKFKNLSQNFNRNRLNEISPIKKELKSEYTDTDDIQNIEQEYDNLNIFNNKILQSCSCGRRNINIFGGPNENKNFKACSISSKSNKNKKDIEDEENKGKEIIEIINDEKDIKNGNNNLIKNNNKENILEDKLYNKIKKNKNVDMEKLNNDLIIKEPNNFFIIQKNESNEKESINFLSIQNNEKEPNIQESINKEYLKKNISEKEYRNEISNVIKDKINLIKNSLRNNKENINHNTEIGDFFMKTKKKEKDENKNILMDKYYQKNSLKVNIKTERKNVNAHKIKISQSSIFFKNKVKSIFGEHKFKNSKMNNNKIKYLNSNSYLTETNITEKNKENKMKKKCNDSIPDINLISEENNEKIKLLDKKDYEKFNFKNRKIKSSRELFPDQFKNKHNTTLNNKIKIGTKKFIRNNYNGFNSVSSLWFYFNNRIMPPNEI